MVPGAADQRSAICAGWSVAPFTGVSLLKFGGGAAAVEKLHHWLTPLASVYPAAF